MAVQELSVDPSLQAQEFTVEIDGIVATAVVRYNPRDDAYYLDGEGASATGELASGVKMVTNWPLLRHYHNEPGDPPGELLVVDTRTAAREAGEGDLGNTHTLVYVPEDDVAEAVGS